jgi:hypothetical protein
VRSFKPLQSLADLVMIVSLSVPRPICRKNA